MRKVKKVILSLLMLVCIPIILGGCSFGSKAPAKSDGQIWYLVNDGYIEDIIIFHGDKVTDYYGFDGKYTSKLIGKSEDEIKKVAKKYDMSSETRNVEYNVYVDNNKKPVEEAIMEKDSGSNGDDDCFACLKDVGTTVKVNGKTLTGFKTVKTPSDYEPTTHSDEYFVTDSKKVNFDSDKTKNVNTYNASDLHTDD